MKYVDEFRDQALAVKLAAAIRSAARPSQTYRFMEFCGGHTHAIFRFGIPDLMPSNVKMVHGPGCPVCVLPMARIDEAVQLATMPGVILCTYGDMLRVPGHKRQSLLKAKAEGAGVHMITSPHEALLLAREHPDKQIVFFAIGFETTTPPTAVVVQTAQKWGLCNFSVHCNHVLTPPAFQWLLDSGQADHADTPPIDGFIGPAHVSAIIGSKPYAIAADRYEKPVVIAGFEPLDVMQAIVMLIRQVNEGRAIIENEYTRAVLPEGNVKAQALMKEVFSLRDTFEWRGLGFIPHSALRLADEYSDFDAEKRFTLAPSNARENPACQCPAILRGAKEPTDCKLFGTVCTPENPIGSCMVSSEGGCAALYAYGRSRHSTLARQ